VFVTKLTAVFNARSGTIGPKCCGLSGMDGEEQDHAGKVEDEEGYGIVEPVLLTRGINTGQAKKGAFKKSQDPDRCVLTREDPAM
jgi:hypothetical protein